MLRKALRIIKKTLKILFILALAVAFIWLVPKAVTVVRLKFEADDIVKKSSVNTFRESKTTLVYDVNGDELCKIKSQKDLYYVNYEDIPETLVHAFVVMEDQGYYSHNGVDYVAIVRAMLANFKKKRVVQGASTITQQVAKNVFLTQEVDWKRKVKEIFISWGLENKYSKEQILEFYLNNIYFGNGYYGVEAAARGYFSKSCSELTLSEQMFLAAIPNNPSRYNPLTKYDNTVSRANRIFKQMYEHDYINSMEYHTHFGDEVILNVSDAQAVNSSVVTYVRHCATEALMETEGFSFRYNFESEEDYNDYEELYDEYYADCQTKLLAGGYSVYTAIDPNLQSQLQASVDDNLKTFTEVSDDGIYKLQGAATCVDNETGLVCAIVGSRSQNIGTYGLNRAYQSYRQPGSTIKGISVYPPYLEKGNTPDTMILDEYMDDGPDNDDDTYEGMITLRYALKRSKNVTAWKIYQEITPRVATGFLMNMRFKKVWYDKDYIAASIGGFTYGVTTEEMASAYATLANDGVYRRVTCVKKLVNNAGKVIKEEGGTETRIFSIRTSRMMSSMLQSVVEPDGTGAGGAIDGVTIAGKTGATNKDYDSWFCGYSHYYTTAVWIGYDYPQSLQRSMIGAADIFSQYMSVIHEELPDVGFPDYTNVTDVVKPVQTQTQTEKFTPSIPTEATGATVIDMITDPDMDITQGIIPTGEMDAVKTDPDLDISETYGMGTDTDSAILSTLSSGD